MDYKKTLSLLSIAALAACGHQSAHTGSVSSVLTPALQEASQEFNSSLTAELFTKILEGNTEDVSKLLSLKADPNGKNSEGTPVLISAIEQNKINIVKVLLESHADVNCVDAHLTTPLMHVVSNGDKEIPKSLSNGTVIFLKPDSKFNRYLSDLLLSQGADIEAKDSIQETALMRAATLNNVDAVAYLLDKGANPNQKNIHGQTPLMVAAKLGFVDVAKCLNKGKADSAATDNEGQTVLIMAVQSGNAEMVRFLISKGALVEAEDVYGASPLKVAQAMGYDEVAAVISEYLKQKASSETL